MCIRDSIRAEGDAREQRLGGPEHGRVGAPVDPQAGQASACLLYTSDAADERSSVDLGGRRIIKKKKE